MKLLHVHGLVKESRYGVIQPALPCELERIDTTPIDYGSTEYLV